MLISFASDLTMLHVCNVCTSTHRYFHLYLFLRHRYLGEDFQFSGRVSLGQIDTVSMSLLLSLCFNMWQFWVQTKQLLFVCSHYCV